MATNRLPSLASLARSFQKRKTFSSRTGGNSGLSSLSRRLSGIGSSPSDQLTRPISFGRVPKQSSGSSGSSSSAISGLARAITRTTTSGGGIGGVLGGFFGISPLVSGIMSLFGGGGDESVPPPLEAFTLPESRSETFVLPSANPVGAQTQMVDAQFFLDHSNEIAAAVKQAILNSHSLNDVISEL